MKKIVLLLSFLVLGVQLGLTQNRLSDTRWKEVSRTTVKNEPQTIDAPMFLSIRPNQPDSIGLQLHGLFYSAFAKGQKIDFGFGSWDITRLGDSVIVLNDGQYIHQFKRDSLGTVSNLTSADRGPIFSTDDSVEEIDQDKLKGNWQVYRRGRMENAVETSDYKTVIYNISFGRTSDSFLGTIRTITGNEQPFYKIIRIMGNIIYVQTSASDESQLIVMEQSSNLLTLRDQNGIIYYLKKDS